MKTLFFIYDFFHTNKWPLTPQGPNKVSVIITNVIWLKQETYASE